MEDVGELRRVVREAYDRGWNDALAAAAKALRAHPVDCVETYRREEGLCELIESLRRPGGHND